MNGLVRQQVGRGIDPKESVDHSLRAKGMVDKRVERRLWRVVSSENLIAFLSERGEERVANGEPVPNEGERDLVGFMNVPDVPDNAENVSGCVDVVRERAGTLLAVEDRDGFDNDVPPISSEGPSCMMLRVCDPESLEGIIEEAEDDGIRP